MLQIGLAILTFFAAYGARSMWTDAKDKGWV